MTTRQPFLGPYDARSWNNNEQLIVLNLFPVGAFEVTSISENFVIHCSACEGHNARRNLWCRLCVISMINWSFSKMVFIQILSMIFDAKISM